MIPLVNRSTFRAVITGLSIIVGTLGSTSSTSVATAAPLLPQDAPSTSTTTATPSMGRPRAASRIRRGRARSIKAATTTTTTTTTVTKPSSPVTVMHNPDPDAYLSGDQSIAVKGNQNPIIRLGLAPNGVTLVEFPAADRIFAVHPGNAEQVFIDSQTANPNDRFLTFRPGQAFVVPTIASGGKLAPQRGPAAEVMVQMNSGLVITFLFYPVRNLTDTAHRVVVMYNRDETIAIRRAAGLSVNLDGKDPAHAHTVSYHVNGDGSPVGGAPADAQATLPSDNALNNETPHNATSQSSTSKATEAVATATSVNKPVTVDAVVAQGKQQRQSQKDRIKSAIGDSNPVAGAATALRGALNSPQQFKKWTPAVHGLSVSTMPIRYGIAGAGGTPSYDAVVVAVKNTLREPVRLLPNHPELYVQTVDDKGKTVNVETLRALHVEGSSIGGAIPAGQTVYFAISYEPQILGAHQNLRISFAQANAADEPAGADLASSAKKRK